jgi:hypothetical protein
MIVLDLEVELFQLFSQLLLDFNETFPRAEFDKLLKHVLIESFDFFSSLGGEESRVSETIGDVFLLIFK